MAKLCLPSEIVPKKAISVLIYGQPGIGKTTVACSASKSVLFDYDGGVNRLNAAHLVPTLQVESWEDTFAALEDLNNPIFADTRTIVIDTVGKMLDYMSEYIMRTNPKMRQYDGTLSLKGYGQRKKMFADFIHTLAVQGRNVIFVAHEKEDKDGEQVIKRPLVGGSSASDLIQELDFVGYMQYRGTQRTISFNPTESYYAKNSGNIPDQVVPVCVDAAGNGLTNDFMQRVVFASYRAAQENKVATVREYERLLKEIDEVVSAVDSLDALNACVEVLAAKPVLYESKIKAGMALNAKARELGATYDKKTKKYVAA